MRSSVNSSWGVPRVFQKASGGAREVPEDCREFQRIPRGWGFRGDLGVFQKDSGGFRSVPKSCKWFRVIPG